MGNLPKIWYNFKMDRYQKLVNDKAKKKREILGKMFFPRTPVVLLDLSEEKNLKPFDDLLDGLAAINVVTLVVVPKGEIQPASTKKIHYIGCDLRSSALEAADFVVMLHGSLSAVRTKGCVPIAELDGEGTIEYNPLQEKGNGFYFASPTKWEIFAAVVKACETYQFPYDWENLVKEVLKK